MNKLITNIFLRIKCWIFGHEFRVHQEFTPWSRRVICDCCNRDWAINDNISIMVPWDDEFAAFYEKQGHELKPLK